jgi:hypothetical protein
MCGLGFLGIFVGLFLAALFVCLYGSICILGLCALRRRLPALTARSLRLARAFSHVCRPGTDPGRERPS